MKFNVSMTVEHDIIGKNRFIRTPSHKNGFMFFEIKNDFIT